MGWAGGCKGGLAWDITHAYCSPPLGLLGTQQCLCACAATGTGTYKKQLLFTSLTLNI